VREKKTEEKREEKRRERERERETLLDDDEASPFFLTHSHTHSLSPPYPLYLSL